MFSVTIVVILNLLTGSFTIGKLLIKSRNDNMYTNSSPLIESLLNLKDDLTNTVIVNQGSIYSELSVQLIKNIKLPVTILEHKSLPKYSICVIFSKDVTFYVRLLKKTTISDKSSFFILWSWPVRNETLEKLFSVAWENKLQNIFVFIEQQSSDINIYTYFPHGPNRCHEVGRPLLINTWNSEKKEFTTKSLRNRIDITKSLMKDFYGCPIKLLVQNRPPDSVALEKQSNLILKGSGGKILGSIAKIYNLTLTVQQVEESVHQDKFGYGISNRSILTVNQILLNNIEFAFAFGVFSYLLNHWPETEFSHYFLIEKFAFHVPCGTLKVWTLWRDYYMEFSAITWVSIACLFVCFAVSLQIVTKVLPHEQASFLSIWRNMFKLLALHLENTVTFRVSTNTMRFLLTVAMFYCTIISVVYRSSLKSFQMAPLEVNSIQSWEELSKSDLKVTGTPEMYSIMNKSSKDHPILENVLKRFKIKTTGEILDIVNEVTVKRDTACFAPEGMIVYYNSKFNEGNKTMKQSICQVNPFLAESPASTFLLRKGSLFIHIVNKVTVDHMQAGYMNHFGASRTIKTTVSHAYKNKQVRYSMNDAKGAFLLLFIGMKISFIVFLLEIMFYHHYFNRAIVK